MLSPNLNEPRDRVSARSKSVATLFQWLWAWKQVYRKCSYKALCCYSFSIGILLTFDSHSNTGQSASLFSSIRDDSVFQGTVGNLSLCLSIIHSSFIHQVRVKQKALGFGCQTCDLRTLTAAARCSTTSPHQVCCCGDGRMKAGGLVVLLGLCHGVSSVIHSLKYFETASSGVSNFPEYVAVGMVDELQFIYYDSNSQKAELKQSWMDQLTRDDPQYLERNTGIYLGAQQINKVNIETAKRRFNQTGGVHMFQRMNGCEWDDEDDTTDGYLQFGYDGEDFIVLDLKNLRWIAPTPQAFFTKLRWDQDRAQLEYLKNYYNKECVAWLKKFLDYGKSTLQRTERPEVSLLQRRPSSPVVCHATGFYPDRVVVFWRRDGDELYEHVDHGEVLPNPDGTFQVSVDLDLTSVPREDWRRYECVVQLKGIEDISTRLDPALVRTNWGKTGPGRDGGVKNDITTPIIIAVLILAAVAAAGVAGVFVYKKRSVPRSMSVSILKVEDDDVDLTRATKTKVLDYLNEQ
ncbi:Major histocompatibility complex class I-related gene protein [Merluccius polli]|uniref:Major histocompatibility complex class I-related gene protein n=1 Tax=Merluccius polli TaxID=89951 RepID=A0AA47NUU3_MERPO|nr:Major histocompatibility complex class I-related gene protein [Merluccius polli]